jgi:ATP-dependent DNA helicase
LEKLVIQKGKFKSLASASSSDSVAELADLLTRDEGEQIIVKEGDEIFTDEELAAILDRSDEAFEKAEKGKSGRFEIVEEKPQDDAFATRT